MDFQEITTERRRLIDSELSSLAPLAGRLLTIWEELSALELRMAGDQSSPRIKSAAEAAFKKSDGPAAEVDITGMIIRQEQLLREYVQIEFKMNRIGRFLQQLSPDEVELASLVYERRYSVTAAADIMGISRRSATYMMDRIRRLFWEFG